MRRSGLFAVLAALALFARPFSAQQPGPAATVDFVRDVQPILRDNCYSCHGPERQSNGLRLDRRRSAMLGGTGTAIGPGSSQSSRLYLRLIGSEFGEQMPKEGHLTKAQIETIKNWIDQVPMEATLTTGTTVTPGVASQDHGVAALATRESSCFSGDRPGSLGLFHTACGGGADGAATSRSSR